MQRGALAVPRLSLPDGTSTVPVYYQSLV